MSEGEREKGDFFSAFRRSSSPPLPSHPSHSPKHPRRSTTTTGQLALILTEHSRATPEKMNSRKSARQVPQTLTRFLKSNSFLKSPPPAYYPILAHPPSASLVKLLPTRPAADLPPSSLPSSSYAIVKRKFDAGTYLTPSEREVLKNPSRERELTRRKPPREANSRNSRPLPIVFPEDELRKQFFRDHPFEAYRPVFLMESGDIREERGPQGAEWTSLSQRSKIPTAEE